MSLIDHHFNNFHHCTAELGLCFQNSVFEKISRHLIFVKNCQNFKFFNRSSAALVSFAIAYQSYPCKKLSEKIIISTIFKGKPKKSEPINSEKVSTTLWSVCQSLFWRINS